MRIPRRWMGGIGIALALAAGLAGCSSDKKLGASDCALGKGGDCGTNGSGVTLMPGTGGGGGAGGSGGSSGVVDVTGTVAILDTSTFDSSVVLPKAATVIAPAPGGTVQGSYGGTNLPFTLTGASSGIQWLFVKDESGGGAGILSTYSAQRLPPLGPLVVPVFDLATLQSIASSQPMPLNLTGTGSQIILFVHHQGAPFAGVTLTSSAFGGTVAYDQSAGVYSSGGIKKTGASGVILMLNVGASASGSELSITLTDESNVLYDRTIPVAAGAATLALFDL